MKKAFSLLNIGGVLALLAAVAISPGEVPAGWNESPRDQGYASADPLTVNLDYFRMAAATGGDFYFWAPGEFETADFPPPLASEPIFLAYGERGNPPERSAIPVDSAVTGLQILVGAQRLGRAILIRPDGNPAEMGAAAGLSMRRFRHMLIAYVDDPEPGEWTIAITGFGAFIVSARYASDRHTLEKRELTGLDLLAFEFVELRGRPGHEGYFPVAETAAIGSEQLCRLTMTGSPERESLQVEFIDGGGRLLNHFPLRSPDQNPVLYGSDEEFFFTCRVPAIPFRVLVRGRDGNGFPFARTTSALITPGE